MKEPIHDDERLAALLAGRLERPERDELLAYLSTADEDYEVFANTAAILREMEEEDAQAEEAGVQVADPPPRLEVLPVSTAKSAQKGRRTPRWIVPAAIVGLAASLLFLLLPPSSPMAGPVQVARNLEQPRAGQSGGWGEIAWGGTRGSGSAKHAPTAAQAGAHLVRLAIAVRTGDSAATAHLATRTRARFDARGGEALLQVAAQAGAPYTQLEPLLEQATERLETRLGRKDLRLGAWLEGARLAAATQDQAFFTRGDSNAMLEHAEPLTEGDPEARAALSRIRTTLASEGPRDWGSLNADLTAVLKAIGTERS